MALKKKKYITSAVPIILIILGCFSIILTGLTQFDLVPSFHFGFVGISISFSLSFWNNKVGNHLAAITLLLGTFGLVTFFFASYTLRWVISDITILKIHPFVLVMLFIHLYFIRKDLAYLFPTADATEDSNNDEPNILEIQRMKNSFSNKSISELEDIMDNHEQYRKEAVMAARELLSYKKSEK